MKRLFPHYGGKYRLAGKMPPPRYGTIVEPFAGGAGYSIRYGAGLRVMLFDIDPETCAIWRFLLSPTAADDVAALPVDPVVAGEDIRGLGLDGGALWFLQRWLTTQGSRSNWRMTPMHKRFAASKPLCMWTGPNQARIVRTLQSGALSRWTIIEGPYTSAPNVQAHWHIDPPYQHNREASRGAYGPMSGVDYADLRPWCLSRRGDVTVHEQAGADWLPFRPFVSAGTGRVDNGRRKTQREVIWTQRTYLFVGAP